MAQTGKKTIWYEASCVIHGKQQSEPRIFPERYVVVGTPLTKRQRYYSGCPLCRQEEKDAEKAKNENKTT